MSNDELTMEKSPISLSDDTRAHYPKIELDDYVPKICSSKVCEGSESASQPVHGEGTFNRDDTSEVSVLDVRQRKYLAAVNKKPSKYFYYDTPLHEETGVWIPVSVRPLPETEKEEWNRSLYLNGGCLNEGDIGWNDYIEEDKEMTFLNVVLNMLLTVRGKIWSLTSGDIYGYSIAWMSSQLLEQAWGEMAQTLTDANFGKMK